MWWISSIGCSILFQPERCRLQQENIFLLVLPLIIQIDAQLSKVEYTGNNEHMIFWGYSNCQHWHDSIEFLVDCDIARYELSLQMIEQRNILHQTICIQPLNVFYLGCITRKEIISLPVYIPIKWIWTFLLLYWIACQILDIIESYDWMRCL